MIDSQTISEAFVAKWLKYTSKILAPPAITSRLVLISTPWLSG